MVVDFYKEQHELESGKSNVQSKDFSLFHVLQGLVAAVLTTVFSFLVFFTWEGLN